MFTAFALAVGALDTDTRTALLQDTWKMLTTTARQQSQALQDEAPERRFLALLADGFASKRAYLENPDGDCPADGDAWGWVRVTRHDRDGDAYHELQRPPQGTLLGHAGEDWLYLFPEQAYQFVAKAARDANSVFPVEANTLLKHLADGGMIATATEAGQVRRTLRQRIGNSNLRVIKLRRTALAGVFPAIQGTSTPQGTTQGTAQSIDSSGSYNGMKSAVPYVPWNGALESHTHVRDTHAHKLDDVRVNVMQSYSMGDSLDISGNIGNTGNIHPESLANTKGKHVPWSGDNTGNIGNVGNPPALEQCPHCGADHMTLVQRQGKTVCVGCSTLSETELARLLASRAMPLPVPSNGTHSRLGHLPLTSTTPVQAADPDDLPDDDERTTPPAAILIASPPREAPPPLRPDPGGTQACPQCDRPLRLAVGGKGVYCTGCHYMVRVAS